MGKNPFKARQFTLMEACDYRMAAYYMSYCDSDTATALAEETAKHLDHPEWLDDEDHWIWELAAEYLEDA